jgi:hypothetical protein
MTTFKEIRGTTIEVVSSDPANPETGQIWYNSSSGTLKGYVFATVNAWASGGNLNTSRRLLNASGLQTASLAFAGYTTTGTGATESYNGSSWTSVNSMNTARFWVGSAGTQSATFAFGGQLPPTNQTRETEDWNGTSWTIGTNYPVFGYHTAAGIQTAAITMVGQSSPDGNPGSAQTYPAATNTYNGTSYSSAPSMNTGRRRPGTSGTQTAALAFGGQPGTGVTTATESYNGTSWTTVGSLNTARFQLVGGGTNTATVAFAGDNDDGTFYSSTELYNGTAWTSNPNSMATARTALGGAGTQAAALAVGGSPNGPGTTAATEEWTGTALQVKTITVS